jgi:hypothetical protein
MSCYNNRYYIKVPDCHNPCTTPVYTCCPKPCCPKPCCPKPCCPKPCCPKPCCTKPCPEKKCCYSKPCKSESMYSDDCHYNKCCSVSCCVCPFIKDFCCLLKKYSEMTRNIYPTDSCCNSCSNGIFNQDFGICYGLYSSTACNDNTFGYIDIEKLNCQIENDYISNCEICCPPSCETNGTLINQSLKIIDNSKFKIAFVFWYKRCHKYVYDIYYGEYKCAKCCDDTVCVKLCYYNSTYGNSCDSSSAESQALNMASQLVC